MSSAICMLRFSPGWRRKDVEKLWLDNVEFKGLVEEKGWLYSRETERGAR